MRHTHSVTTEHLQKVISILFSLLHYTLYLPTALVAKYSCQSCVCLCLWMVQQQQQQPFNGRLWMVTFEKT